MKPPGHENLSLQRSTTIDPNDIDRIIAMVDAARPEAPNPDDSDADSKMEKVEVPSDLLETDPSKGLNQAEVTARRKQFGPNELSENVENLWKKFFMYFVGPIQFVMELAVCLAGGLQLWIDFGVICAILILNAIVGFFQEFHAGNIVAQLKTSMALKARVIRDGQMTEVNAIDIVPGDIVSLQEGSIVPADGRIIGEDAFLQIDQSNLTGESLAVDKSFEQDVFSGSEVKRGNGNMIVTAIGDRTFLGKTAALVNKTEKVGHFTVVLSSIGRNLLFIVFIFIMVVVISGFYRSSSIVTILQNILIITVIGVPVGLPAVVTTTIAVGAAELATKKAIVRRLAAIESLAGVDVLCSDKTGTLTQNLLTLYEPFVAPDSNIEELICTSVLACSRSPKGMDAIDRAIWLALQKYPNSIRDEIKSFHTKSFKPFDPVTKLVAAVVEDPNGNTVTCVKGAPAAVLRMITDEHSVSDEFIQEYNSKIEEYASKGFRCLGIAKKTNKENWVILGLLTLLDPPRVDAIQTLDDARGLGLTVKMLTGDSTGIAKETAKQLGLGAHILDVSYLPRTEGDRMAGLSKLIEESDGFAEVFPEHKYLVVDELQRTGHLVAMTGDGVNDAPSLKKADVGIAVEGATSAARSAADIVFLRAGLSVIIAAVKTSRQIFQRMQSYVIYRIALSLQLEIFLSTTLAILNDTISVELVAFLAIFADISTLMIAYDNAEYSRQPTDWNLTRIWIFSSILGVYLAGASWVLLGTTILPSPGIIQSYGSQQGILFLQVALTQSWLIFITRYTAAFSNISWPSWQLVSAVLAVDAIATLFCIFGWFTGQETDIVTTINVWIYSFGVTAVAFLIYYVMLFLDIGGKPRRHGKNKLETA